MFNVYEARKVQGEYCEANKLPHFAPHDGRCYVCNKQIYDEIMHDRVINGIKNPYTTGISVEEANSKLVTGCPHCNYSYCN